MSIRAIVLVLLGATATRVGAQRAQAGTSKSVLAAIGEVTIKEPDSLYLASPTFMAPLPDGGFVFSEGFSTRVIRYDRTGKPTLVIGRKGSGPGEFVAPGTIAIVSDTVIAIHDAGQRAFELFDQRNGRYLRLVRIEGVPTTIFADRDSVFVGLINLRQHRRSGMAAFGARSDSARYFAPIPDEYVRSRAMASALPLAAFARWKDSLLIGFAGHPGLFLAKGDGTVLDTLVIPARLRRGVPPDLVAQYERPMTSEIQAGLNSVVTALHRLPSGQVAMVHFDYSVRGQLVTAKGFLTVLDVGKRAACIDTPLPLAADARPLVAFRGDALLLFEQTIVDGNRAVSQVRSYRIDPTGCVWQMVGRGRG